jgi:hypothetical protein
MSDVKFKGATVLLRVQFRDQYEELSTMATVTLKIVLPDDTVTNISSGDITYDSVNIRYTYKYTPAQTGDYYLIWTGVDANNDTSVVQDMLIVTPVKA